MPRITKAALTRRTESIEKFLIKHNLHPGKDYRLTLDYAACYGGYKMIWIGPKHSEYYFWLSAQRLTASQMESYQQGIFDLLHALSDA